MFSISSSQPVSWPSAPSTAVAPVVAVPSVGATASATRDTQADSGRSGTGSRGAPSPGAVKPSGDATAPSGAQAAPLLPRERSDEPANASAFETEEAQAEQRKEDEKKAQEQAAHKLQLQDVLASVWKASAAVVDVVLGREAALAAAGPVDGVSDALPVAGDPSGDPVPASLVSGESLPATGASGPQSPRREQEPLMYTEQGTSSWAPLESGSLISRRV